MMVGKQVGTPPAFVGFVGRLPGKGALALSTNGSTRHPWTWSEIHSTSRGLYPDAIERMQCNRNHGSDYIDKN
jgi:hypothetical protein